MAAKHDSDVDDARRAFVRQLEERLERAQMRAPRPAMLRKDKRQLLAQLKKRLEATIAARDQAIEAYDAEIRRRKSAIARLEEEIGRLEPEAARAGTKPARK